MRHRHVRAAAPLVPMLLGALLLSACAPGGSAAKPSPATARASATPAPSAVALATDRLTIAAMRARAYPASQLQEVRSDGDRGGFVNSVVSFQSDGLTEYALQSVPDGPRPARGWPVIIINHGYIPPASYVTDDASYAQFIAAFARAGYMVLKPDYRGHGQSQGVAEGGHLSPVYAWDLLNLISTVRADGRIDPSRIGLFGHSMGGHEALRALVVSSAIKAAVFLAGVVGSFYDLFYNWPQQPVHTDPSAATQQQVAQGVVSAHGPPTTSPPSPSGSANPTASPSPGALFWDAASAVNFVGATSAAVQIDQDVADTSVPKLFADHLDAALLAAGKSVQYNLYPGDDHQFTRNRAAVLASEVAFYRAHL